MRRTKCVSMKIPLQAYAVLRRESKAMGLSPGELARHLFFGGLCLALRGLKTPTFAFDGPVTFKISGRGCKPPERAENRHEIVRSVTGASQTDE